MIGKRVGQRVVNVRVLMRTEAVVVLTVARRVAAAVAIGGVKSRTAAAILIAVMHELRLSVV